MGKFLVAVLATLAAVWMVVYFVGPARMTGTAFSVPATEHTHSFGITWTLLVGGVLGFFIWRTVKGK